MIRDKRSESSDDQVPIGNGAWTTQADGEGPAVIRHNPVNPMDVDHDGVVAPIDVLVVINAIRRYGTATNAADLPASQTGFVDVNGDQSISPVDVLQVINFLSFANRFPTVATVAPVTSATKLRYSHPIAHG